MPKNVENLLCTVAVITCGAFIALGIIKENTNVILAFGFILNALMITWSKK